jgi:hypothetical protein
MRQPPSSGGRLPVSQKRELRLCDHEPHEHLPPDSAYEIVEESLTVGATVVHGSVTLADRRDRLVRHPTNPPWRISACGGSPPIAASQAGTFNPMPKMRRPPSNHQRLSILLQRTAEQNLLAELARRHAAGLLEGDEETVHALVTAQEGHRLHLVVGLT